MPNQQPIVTSVKGRRFACSPAAVIGVIVDDRERFLLLHSPKTPGWQPVNGGLEANETAPEGTLREIAEEAGPQVRVRPLGTLHAHTFHYDDNVQFMLSLFFLFAYEGGDVIPGDDMAGSEYRWWSLDELHTEQPLLLVPGNDHLWLFERALALYRL